MSQIVRIETGDTTFFAACDACGTSFAGRLDDDLEEGVFLCRFGHQIHIERESEPPAEAAVA